VLPDLQSTDSSEALLTGRRPPFRLVVYAADAVGSISSSVRYTASEEFVVSGAWRAAAAADAMLVLR
jgi:hypothetical protein